MYVNQFSVRVVGGLEVAGGYVRMRHAQTYSIRLRNDQSVCCDARVEVDGTHVGTWRVEPHSSIEVERPANDDGHFTFYKLGSAEASKAGGSKGSQSGLIAVTFKPGLRPIVVTQHVHHFHYDWWPWEPWPVRSSPMPCLPWHQPSWIYTNSAPTTVAPAACDMSVTCSSAVARSATPELSPGITGLSGHSDQEFTQAPAIEHSQEATTIYLRLVCAEDVEEVRPLSAICTPVPPALPEVS